MLLDKVCYMSWHFDTWTKKNMLVCTYMYTCDQIMTSCYCSQLRNPIWLTVFYFGYLNYNLRTPFNKKCHLFLYFYNIPLMKNSWDKYYNLVWRYKTFFIQNTKCYKMSSWQVWLPIHVLSAIIKPAHRLYIDVNLHKKERLTLLRYHCISKFNWHSCILHFTLSYICIQLIN